jgi:hypothetical protein
MKLPRVPQFTEDDINAAIGLAKEPAVFKAAVEYNTRYLHGEVSRTGTDMPVSEKTLQGRIWCIYINFIRF